MKQENETYLHRKAIEVLHDWIRVDYLRIDLEQQFSIGGFVKFIPDLTCYDENGIEVIYEVTYKSPINAFKLAKMQLYFWNHNITPLVYEIDAKWILKNVNKPDKLETIRMI